MQSQADVLGLMIRLAVELQLRQVVLVEPVQVRQVAWQAEQSYALPELNLRARHEHN